MQRMILGWVPDEGRKTKETYLGQSGNCEHGLNTKQKVISIKLPECDTGAYAGERPCRWEMRIKAFKCKGEMSRYLQLRLKKFIKKEQGSNYSKMFTFGKWR